LRLFFRKKKPSGYPLTSLAQGRKNNNETAMIELPIVTQPAEAVAHEAELQGEETVSQERRLYIETYGCQMNVNDSEIVKGILRRYGFRPTDKIDQADVIFLNTCSVRENAERKIFERLTWSLDRTSTANCQRWCKQRSRVKKALR